MTISQTSIDKLTNGEPGPDLEETRPVTANMDDIKADAEQKANAIERCEQAEAQAENRMDRIERGVHAVRADPASKV